MRDPGRSEPGPPSDFRSSAAALLLGILLALVVTKLLDIAGWGGELASQAAGAASGSAPLLIDGVRRYHRRSTRMPLTEWLHGQDQLPAVLVASAFAFAVLVFDSVVSFVLIRVTRAVITISRGDPVRFDRAYLVVGMAVNVPFVLIVTAVVAVAATHRLPEHHKRWICFGMGVFTVIRMGQLILGNGSTASGASLAVLLVSTVLTAGLLLVAALLGSLYGNRTRPAFIAAAHFRRLSAEDQRAALALLSDRD